LVPEVEGEIFVGAAQSSNEMVFECAYGAFGGIVTVDMQWDQLVIHIFSDQKVFKDL